MYLLMGKQQQRKIVYVGYYFVQALGIDTKNMEIFIVQLSNRDFVCMYVYFKNQIYANRYCMTRICNPEIRFMQIYWHMARNKTNESNY